MSDQIFIGDFGNGLKKNIRIPPYIDNDAFPTLFNMYAWRGGVWRKRGTKFLGRLQRQIESFESPTFATSPWEFGPLALTSSGGNGIGNLITGPWTTNLTSSDTLEPGSSIVPGSISFVVGANTYAEPATPNGTLIGTPAGSGTINYATGAVAIAGGGVGPLIGTFSYYPDLTVLGLEDFVSGASSSKFPLLLAFDQTYSYQINQNGTPFFYSTSYYKGTNNPVVWSNTDDNQFWSTNYQSAFWVTNNKPGLHFLNGAYVSGTGTTDITFTFTSLAAPFTTLIVGDKLWFNEWPTTSTLNGQTGTVLTVLTVLGVLQYIVRFTSVQTVVPGSTGIVQMLTNSLPNQDGIRWYDGDPTGGTGIPNVSGFGWVNFAPPLTALVVSINDQQADKYYLVGALAILPFKDRLLFFGPQIQSTTSVVIQLPIQDTVFWSWNGTPYYNALVPAPTTQTRETFDISAYYVDQTGKGGYLPAGISQPLVTVLTNEDVLLLGFGGGGKKTRFVYTGNDLQPFLFYLINSEIPSSCTFSGVNMDDGGIEIGQYGITVTTQQSCQRIDIDIPDEVFTIQSLNNGVNRVNAIRDFFREWIYFAYPLGDGKESNGSWKYPAQTFMLNYRDSTWAIFRENFTKHGTFRLQAHYTWATLPFKTWATWREPWNAGSSTALFPSIIAGNPQGYVLIKGEGTGEAPSGDIAAIANDGLGFTQITSIKHCVNSGSSFQGTRGDYLYFQGAIGSTFLNNNIGLVTRTIDANNFVVDIPFAAGTYLGLGTFTRLSIPHMQTKQFPVYWQEGRKVRLGVQKYLLDTTSQGQITVNINLSQDPDDNWNEGPIVPARGVTNSSLVYSQTLYTCPESTNLGLTPANTNLQMPIAKDQYQIWHRINTSLIGDTVQVGLTLSDVQMRNLDLATTEIALHAIHLSVSRGPILA